MTSWAISVCYSVIICSVVFILLPENRISAFSKPIIALTVLLSVLSPLKSDSEILSGSKNSGYKSQVFNESGFLEYIGEMKIAEYRQNCIKIAENNGVICEDVSIEYNVTEDGAISITCADIKLKNTVISSDKQHIDIVRRLKTDISAYLDLNEAEVRINGE